MAVTAGARSSPDSDVAELELAGHCFHLSRALYNKHRYADSWAVARAVTVYLFPEAWSEPAFEPRAELPSSATAGDGGDGGSAAAEVLRGDPAAAASGFGRGQLPNK